MKVNLCRSAGAWSRCAARDITAQENCTYYELATNANRCMYYMFDYHCDNWWAQKGKIPPDSKIEAKSNVEYEPCKGCSYSKSCTKRATDQECDDATKKSSGVEAFK